MSKSSTAAGASAPSTPSLREATRADGIAVAPDHETLARLVEQLLLARLEGFEARQVAAFLAGWTSALDLVRRTDLLLPTASAGLRQAIAGLVDGIDRAQRAALADPEDQPSG